MPQLLAKLTYPVNERMGYELDDGVGLQAFVLIASDGPLPPYRQWQARVGPAPWRKADAEDAWRFDGVRFDRLGGSRSGERPRATARPPSVFQELCDFFKTAPDIDAVHACAFPVVDSSEAATTNP